MAAMFLPQDGKPSITPGGKEDVETATIRLYQERIAQLEGQIAAIHKSYSWRLTWPVRKLGGLALKFMQNLRTRAQHIVSGLLGLPKKLLQATWIRFRAFLFFISRNILYPGSAIGLSLPFKHRVAEFPLLRFVLDRLIKKTENAAFRPSTAPQFSQEPVAHVLRPPDMDISLKDYNPAQGVHHDLRSPLEAYYIFYRKAK